MKVIRMAVQKRRGRDKEIIGIEEKGN